MISGNGRFVVFYSGAPELVPGDTNLTFDAFIRDLDTSTTSRSSVSSLGLQGDGPSSNPSISTSGRWVAFESNAFLRQATGRAKHSINGLLVCRTQGDVCSAC